jgi:hypothetical protein
LVCEEIKLVANTRKSWVRAEVNRVVTIAVVVGYTELGMEGMEEEEAVMTTRKVMAGLGRSDA